MSQLSLFSADLTPPQLVDLGGLLAAHGQITTGADGVRLSILLSDPWRASALLRECRVRDVPAQIPPQLPGGPPVARPDQTVRAEHDGESDQRASAEKDPQSDQSASEDRDGPSDAAPPKDQSADRDVPSDRPTALLHTDRTPMLAALAAQWTRGAVKAVPADIVLTPGFLRCWTLAAGHPADVGFVLGLDPHAPDTHEPLAAACAAAGLAGSLLGTRGGGPAVRIVGYRRCSRLSEMIGTPPPEAPPGAFPALGH